MQAARLYQAPGSPSRERTLPGDPCHRSCRGDVVVPVVVSPVIGTASVVRRARRLDRQTDCPRRCSTRPEDSTMKAEDHWTALRRPGFRIRLAEAMVIALESEAKRLREDLAEPVVDRGTSAPRAATSRRAPRPIADPPIPIAAVRNTRLPAVAVSMAGAIGMNTASFGLSRRRGGAQPNVGGRGCANRNQVPLRRRTRTTPRNRGRRRRAAPA